MPTSAEQVETLGRRFRGILTSFLALHVMIMIAFPELSLLQNAVGILFAGLGVYASATRNAWLLLSWGVLQCIGVIVGTMGVVTAGLFLALSAPKYRPDPTQATLFALFIIVMLALHGYAAFLAMILRLKLNKLRKEQESDAAYEAVETAEPIYHQQAVIQLQPMAAMNKAEEPVIANINNNNMQFMPGQVVYVQPEIAQYFAMAGHSQPMMILAPTMPTPQ